MALDPNATTKDFSLVIYTKTEIDTLLTDISNSIALGLSSKSDSSAEGSPSGIATLNSNGHLELTQIPIATLAESGDSSNETKLITSKSLQYQIATKAINRSNIGIANGVAPLNNNTVIDDIYLPAARNVHTFVVDLLLDMYSLPDVSEGDRCVVTQEDSSTDNGEYVAKFDYPVDASGWDQLPNLSSVSSVNGATGDITITSIQESADNTSRLDTVEPILVDQESRLSTVETTSSINSTDILTKADDSKVNDIESALTTRLDTTDGKVTTNEDRLSALESAADMPYNYSNVQDISVQTETYTSLNTLTTSSLPAGTYQVTLSMLFGINSVVRSAYFRFSLDGDNNWTEVKKEAKDVTDLIPTTLVLVEDFTGGEKTIEIEAKCEDSSDTITISNQTIIYERKV